MANRGGKPAKTGTRLPSPVNKPPARLNSNWSGWLAWSKWLAVALALMVAAIPFCYGKYLEFSTDGAFDGGLNVYHAKCLVQGQKISQDVNVSARPATLLVNVIGVALFGFSELGPKIIQTIMQLAALLLMFATLRKIYGIIPAATSLILAAFYLSCPPYSKYGNAKEQFMIACMIVAACSLMLRHYGRSRWWLILSGAAAVNAFYFKPTGVSVAIAMVIYLLTQPFLPAPSDEPNRLRYRWRQMIEDINLLLIGSIAGLVPLSIFYIWQERFGGFLLRFPASAVILLTAIAMPCFVLCRLAALSSRYDSFNFQWQTHKRLWLTLLILLAVVSIPSISYTGLNGIPLIKAAMCLPHKAVAFMNIDTGGGSYLAGSRSVSDFQSQYNTVTRYYGSFIIPIGLSLLAIIWGASRFIAHLTCRPNRIVSIPDAATPQQKIFRQGPDRFVLLLGVWWILDMCFVWVSPRSYVEYFLPLNASAAMLAAYAIFRCWHKTIGFVWLLATWPLVDLILTWPIPSATLPYITLRTANTVQAYWGNFFWFTLPLIIAIFIYILLRKNRPAICKVLLASLLCISIFQFNADNLKAFSDRVAAQQGHPISLWEQIGDYIRDNSGPDDGLYVWGWYPGIYVRAQRFCPAGQVAESNMHTDSPPFLGGKINTLVKQLQDNPPRFIVDSQKMEYPYNTHPVFDLWPRTPGENPKFWPAQGPDTDRSNRQLCDYVEQYVYTMLTHPKRPAGPLPQEKARSLAQLERNRHEQMLPLRRFVMANYQPVTDPRSGMFVFKLKNK